MVFLVRRSKGDLAWAPTLQARSVPCLLYDFLLKLSSRGCHVLNIFDDLAKEMPHSELNEHIMNHGDAERAAAGAPCPLLMRS